MRRVAVTLMALLGVVAPARADEPRPLDQIGGVLKRAQQFRDLQITEAEEQQLGAAVSERVRARYGVVQDANVHKYVTLVGTSVAQATNKPNLPWTFIVLDTDAVNAFAAPGGFVHITRGALALAEDESELAGVLGHEVIHITEQHTIRSIQKSKAIQMGADETLSGNAALFNRLVDNVYLSIIDNTFGRAEEHESDEKGMVAANKVGYAPQGVGKFLTRLQERNKDSKEQRGLFASHPAMKERIDRLTKQIASQKLAGTATLADRYRKNVSYKSVPLSGIAVVEGGSAGLAGESKPEEKTASKPEEKKDQPKKSGFGGLTRMLPAGGGEKKSAQVTASAAARGVDPERDAKGGTSPKLVPVKITAAELAAFKKEGGLA